MENRQTRKPFRLVMTDKGWSVADQHNKIVAAFSSDRDGKRKARRLRGVLNRGK